MIETKEQKTQRFKELCIEILSQSGNCMESQHDFHETETIQQMCSAWWKYWHGLITEVPMQVVRAFDTFYPDFKTEINAAGFYYNEDARNGIVLIGNSEKPIHLSESKRVTILGSTYVMLHRNASALALNPNCTVELFDGSIATIKEGYGVAHDHSHLTTLCDARCFDSSIVHITNGTLLDYGHSLICAYGDATIKTFTNKLIQLYDKSKLNYELTLDNTHQ